MRDSSGILKTNKSTTKIEQNEVNAVCNFVDATDTLRSYLEENDKTQLWDGSIFVYDWMLVKASIKFFIVQGDEERSIRVFAT